MGVPFFFVILLIITVLYNCFCVSRNCLQYEPDHPIHIRTLSLVHSHVSESGSFDTLIATRFHLICFWNKLGLVCFAGTMDRWCSTCAGTSSKMNCLFIWWWTTGSYQLNLIIQNSNLLKYGDTLMVLLFRGRVFHFLCAVILRWIAIGTLPLIISRPWAMIVRTNSPNWSPWKNE